MKSEKEKPGEKKDQVFHELVSLEYNKSGIQSYDENAWPHLTTGRSLPPSKYQNIDRKKSRDAFKNISNEYDQAFKNWKVSGFHGDIPTDLHEMTEVCDKPFSDFSKSNTSILYMHQFVYQFPDVLSKVTGLFLFSIYILH